MHLIKKLFAVIIFSILNFKIACTSSCCKNNGTIKDSKTCDDGTSINVSCEASYPILLNPDWGIYSSFIIGDDARGEYLDAYVAGYVIREPYFCTGFKYYNYSRRTSKVAVTCSSYRDWYHEQSLNGTTEAKEEARYFRIYSIFADLFNFLSAVAFAMTAAIYYFLPEVQDLQGNCYFHFTFIGALGHVAIAYMELFDTEGLLPNMCITNVYLEVYFLLCGFMWTGVVCYNTWRDTKNTHTEDEQLLFRKYKMFAYGVPFTLLVFAWIHVHVEHFSEFEFVLECYVHQKTIFEYYIAIPILSTLFVNLVMFIHAQIKVWTLHAVEVRKNKLTSQIVKYRFFMNAKLFFIMGVPWTIYVIAQLIDVVFFTGTYLTYVEGFLTLLLLGEGIPIFIILVLFRKRVLRGMANRWFTNTNVFPEKWKTVKDSETEEEDEEDQPEKGNTNVQVRYSPQNDFEDKFNHSTSIITL